ncbi:MAG TPA: valine--tRNA ligase [Gemmatimonadales bacterium]|jgi:valyl-tRNA synthetase|nr:valine--tRNA ligase [Gemmatimonadales bacterium]
MPAPRFELAPQYDPRAVEPSLYRRWLERGAFAPRASGEPYIIVIPPPNVTAVLHVGHGLNNIIQDVLIRFERMRGRAALWLPGTDHAGIATQNVVEKQLAAEGKTRFDLGREAFVERVWAFVRETGDTIIEQLKIIGCSCDWSRTRFTLDEAYSRAVREVFVTLWEEQLIYRGHRVIHWCPHCLTALSDEEAEHHDTSGNLYHIKYPLVDGSGFVTVATTRPETMLGDTAVAVHPDDPRGRPAVGKNLRLPIANVEIPVIADETVDRAFGTGFVKVTPAHDASDFEIGLRHRLPMPLIMREDGTLGEPSRVDGRTGRRPETTTARPPDRPSARRVPPDLEGLDRFEARKRIVKQLERDGLLAKVEQHQHSVRRCYRCETVVEPRLSDQWFVKMRPLAEPVLAEYRRGAFRLVPERWRATFEHWMENIRDWNISRQLWWGHRIPVFTCKHCGHQWADRTDPTTCPECDGGGGPVEQDPDVLDTWFSSWLWPFATLGWPQRTPDLERFYPGHTMVTAPEILFFWVARMLMSGYHFMDRRLPFTTVYLTGTVRDTQHRKMSKSLGNGIDPRDVVRLYGTDALRWTLIGGGSLGADVIVDPNDLETTFAPGRNFANKLWNIGRFILSQLPAEVTPIDGVDRTQLTLADRWILSRAQAMTREATASLEQFRLDEAAKRCYEFAWNELADWYVEAVKPRLGTTTDAGAAPRAAGALRAAARGAAPASAAHAVLAYCFDVVLRLLHPVVPFITEELWQKLPGRTADELLIVAPWPRPQGQLEDAEADVHFGRVKTAIELIRSIRAEYRIPPKTRLRATIVARGGDRAATFAGERDTILRLGQLESLTIDGGPAGASVGGGAHAVFGDGSEVIVALEGAIDVQQECSRLSHELSRLDGHLAGLAAKLTNENFVSRAPAEVVAREREKEKAWRDQRAVLAGKLKALGCS